MTGKIYGDVAAWPGRNLWLGTSYENIAGWIRMSPQIFCFYLGTWFMVALTPGPAVMCTMTQASRYGARSSWAGISGIQVGNVVFFICIGLGFTALLETATTAFTILRMAGAIYLFYLGVRIMASTWRRDQVALRPGASCAAAPGGLFLQGLAVQVSNPKALLFVSALLPQFIDPKTSMSGQLLSLGLATVAVDTVVLSGYASLAGRGGQRYRASRFSLWLERALGASLAFFGCRLLFSRK